MSAVDVCWAVMIVVGLLGLGAAAHEVIQGNRIARDLRRLAEGRR